MKTQGPGPSIQTARMWRHPGHQSPACVPEDDTRMNASRALVKEATSLCFYFPCQAMRDLSPQILDALTISVDFAWTVSESA